MCRYWGHSSFKGHPIQALESTWCHNNTLIFNNDGSSMNGSKSGRQFFIIKREFVKLAIYKNISL